MRKTEDGRNMADVLYEQMERLNTELDDFMKAAISEYCGFWKNRNDSCCKIRNTFNGTMTSEWKHKEAQARYILFLSYAQIADYMNVFARMFSEEKPEKLKVVSFYPGPLTDYHALQRVLPLTAIDFTAVDVITWEHALAGAPGNGRIDRQEGEIHSWFMDNPEMDADLYILHRNMMDITLDSLWSAMARSSCSRKSFTFLVLDRMQSESKTINLPYRLRMENSIKGIAERIKEENGNPYLVTERSFTFGQDNTSVRTYIKNTSDGLKFNPSFDYMNLFGNNDRTDKCKMHIKACDNALTYKPCMNIGKTYAHAYDFSRQI